MDRGKRQLRARWAAFPAAAFALAWVAGNFAPGQTPILQADPQLRHGRDLLAARQFQAAKQVYSRYLRVQPGAVQAELGLGDAELGLRQFEAAEASYRAAVAAQPELWQAHKNVVVVEAALGRWEEFDRERIVLRMARERGAPGISTRESDVIDSFSVHGGHWVVRSYFEPLGRSEARYNFERFSADGRVQAYLSLEDAAAARAALAPGDVRVGGKSSGETSSGETSVGGKGAAAANSPGTAALSLNWYTNTAHGAVRTYRAAEPAYRQLRADAMRWLEQHPEIAGAGPTRTP